MSPTSLVKKLAGVLSASSGEQIELSAGMACQGTGSQTCQVIGHTSVGQKRYMLKTCQPDHLPMLQAEADNLQAIAMTQTIRVPDVIWCGELEGQAGLLLEWLDLQATGDWPEMAQQITRLHAYPNFQTSFGWPANNFIGATPQPNKCNECWADFFAEQRIGYQLELAARNGFSFGSIDMLTEQVRQILKDHKPAVSLLHGDLWSGNIGFNVKAPVIFDPACYYGDREVDLAMATLFGGFSARFFQTSNALAPLPEGWELRRTLYNLYHLLNHLNMFGDSWQKDIQRSLQLLLETSEQD